MMAYEDKRQKIFRQVQDFSPSRFNGLALEIFHFQAEHNELYSNYLSLLNKKPGQIRQIQDIPFLPIQFFKNYEIKTSRWKEQFIFASSGTTGSATSQHFVRDLDFYLENTVRGFEQFYGEIQDYLVLALLPSYLERSGSSLVAMAGHFIGLSKYSESGFFLDNTEELIRVLENMKRVPQSKVLLLGVSFALLAIAEQHDIDLSTCIIMETGGMKGRRQEMTRPELHRILQNSFHVNAIHSEYGMTELFSQAWSKGDGRFMPATTMKVLTREITDPLSSSPIGRTGALNIIDLANFDTCSFIATDDLGRVEEDGSFEVLGRLDDSDIRGCNLLVQKSGIGE